MSKKNIHQSHCELVHIEYTSIFLLSASFPVVVNEVVVFSVVAVVYLMRTCKILPTYPENFPSSSPLKYTGRPHALTEQSVHTLNHLQQSFDVVH